MTMIEDCHNDTNCSSKSDNNEHKCNLCPMVVKKKSNLDKHLKGHSKNNCTHCDAQFTKRKELCKHLKTEHNINEPEKLYVCSCCRKSFFKKSLLNRHMKIHADGKLSCTQCGFIGENHENYADHVRTHIENSKYECEPCGKKFARCQQYNQHMAGHKKHICKLCNVTFSAKKLLRKHQQNVHGAKILKNHHCEICGKRFNRPCLLASHQQIHTGEKQVKCDHCNKSYISSDSLAKHMKTVRHLKRVHKSGSKEVNIEKGFTCDKCGAKFYRQQTLLRHVEMMHVAGEPFKCEFCSYSTKCKQNLKRHSELHSQTKRFTCELCGRVFRASQTLREHHVFVHNEKRDYVCDLCEKCFKSNSDLQRHRKIHSNDRPYKCSCIMSFKRLSHLKRHLLSSKHFFNTPNIYAQTEGFPKSGEINTKETKDTCQSEDLITNVDSPTISIQLDNIQDSISDDIFNLGESQKDTISDDVVNNVENQDENNKLLAIDEEAHTFQPLDDVQVLFDTCPVALENITFYPLLEPIITLTKLSISKNMSLPQMSAIVQKPVVSLKNDVTSENISMPQLTAIMEQPIVSLTNECSSETVSMPSLTAIMENSAITISEQVPSENLAMSSATAAVDQPSEESPTENIHTQVSDKIKQVDATPQDTLLECEPQTTNVGLVENQTFNLKTKSNCSLRTPNVMNPINIEQSSVLQHENSSQIILSVPSEQENSSRPASLPNFSFQPPSLDSCDQICNDDVWISFLNGDTMFPTYFSDLEQNGCSKQLFGESGDILITLPPLYASDCQSELVNSPMSTDFLDMNCNKLTFSGDGIIGDNMCDTIYSTMPNLITTLPMNVDNSMISNEPLISHSIAPTVYDTEFESFL